jgi:hypothetical protein
METEPTQSTATQPPAGLGATAVEHFSHYDDNAAGEQQVPFTD